MRCTGLDPATRLSHLVHHLDDTWPVAVHGRAIVADPGQSGDLCVPGVGVTFRPGGRAGAADPVGKVGEVLTGDLTIALVGRHADRGDVLRALERLAAIALTGRRGGIHPALCPAAALRRDRTLARRLASAPPVSVIVPAFNEALTIVPSVRSLLALDYESREIVVVNDGSSDDTLAGAAADVSADGGAGRVRPAVAECTGARDLPVHPRTLDRGDRQGEMAGRNRTR